MLTACAKACRHFSWLLVPAALLFALPGQTEDSPWTTKPVRVDRSNQNYERLPPPEHQKKKRETEQKRFVLRLPAQITMRNSTMFSALGKDYALDGVEPIPAEKICTSATGSHWPCGRRGAMFSGKLLRRQLLRCTSAIYTDTETRLSDCRVGNKNVQAEIVLAGQAFAVSKAPELDTLMQKAREARKGVWRDEACFENDEGC